MHPNMNNYLSTCTCFVERSSYYNIITTDIDKGIKHDWYRAFNAKDTKRYDGGLSRD